jgi:hypothetical protein
MRLCASGFTTLTLPLLVSRLLNGRALTFIQPDGANCAHLEAFALNESKSNAPGQLVSRLPLRLGRGNNNGINVIVGPRGASADVARQLGDRISSFGEMVSLSNDLESLPALHALRDEFPKPMPEDPLQLPNPQVSCRGAFSLAFGAGI